VNLSPELLETIVGPVQTGGPGLGMRASQRDALRNARARVSCDRREPFIFAMIFFAAREHNPLLAVVAVPLPVG
jgi:hypothetical protein